MIRPIGNPTYRPFHATVTTDFTFERDSPAARYPNRWNPDSAVESNSHAAQAGNLE